MNESDFFARWSRLKQEARTHAPSAAPVDLASPPPLEFLTSESDPIDTVLAALRSAWRLDPEIRDFIGIAESQWDFNDPNAMPGFGPLEAMDTEAAVVKFSTPTTAGAAQAPIDAPQNFNPQRDGQVDSVWLSGESSREANRSTSEAGDERQGTLAPAAAQDPGAPRRHGSALPRPS
jgi:hypothetical protein